MQRQCIVNSATLQGVEARLVTVEISIGSGIPGMAIVGMADSSVQEARERVKAALKSCGFEMPREKIVVNLAPGTLRKTGTGFDLPIALGILMASGQLAPSPFEQMMVVGELSLEGRTRAVPGMLAFELCALRCGFGLLCPSDAGDIMELDGLRLVSAASLADFRTGEFDHPRTWRAGAAAPAPDFREVGGHEQAKRALQIAATGGHGLLMMGPPGSGKTMLAQRLPSILPDLTDEERLQTAQVYSAAGEPIGAIAAGMRPFRHPHHSISHAGLLGGGNPIRPGEVSLAHNGVCFLDELPQFSKATLQGLRQPMEDGRITIVRAEGAFAFPARFMLVAASNPCPCGFYGDAQRACSCSFAEVTAYQQRIGGPLLDRIDLQIDVWRSDFDTVAHAGGGISSAQLKEGVLAGREFRSWRLSRLRDASASRRGGGGGDPLEDGDLLSRNAVNAQAEEFLREMARSHLLSGRGIVRTVGVARTIADIAGHEEVDDANMAEALGYRLRGGSS